MFVHRALFEAGMTRPSIKQTTGIQNLDADHYLGLVVAMPALVAQRGIASELDEELARQDGVAASIERSQRVIREHQDSAVLRLFETDERGDSNETGNRWFPRLREGLRVTRIKHLAMKVGSGKTPKGGADVYVSEGVMFLRSQNVHHQGLLLDDVARIPPAIDHEMAQTRVREGDVLLNITGASLGRCTVFPAGMQRANVNQHVCIIRPARPSAGSLIAAAMSLPAVQAQIRAMQVGGNRDGLNFEQVGNLEVPLPDPAVTAHLTEEVERALHEHNSLLELGDRSLAVLTERRRGVVRSAILHAQPTARRSL
jgi:type I restriction enzyme S subunit